MHSFRRSRLAVFGFLAFALGVLGGGALGACTMASSTAQPAVEEERVDRSCPPTGSRCEGDLVCGDPTKCVTVYTCENGSWGASSPLCEGAKDVGADDDRDAGDAVSDASDAAIED